MLASIGLEINTDDLANLINDGLFANQEFDEIIANLSGLPILVDLLSICSEMHIPLPKVEGPMKLEHVLSTIYKVAPIDVDNTYQNMFDAEEEVLIAESPFYYYNFESFIEDVQENVGGHDGYRLDIPTEILYYCLNYGFDEEIFLELGETFGWQHVVPRYPDKRVDLDRFYKILNPLSKDVAMAMMLFFGDTPGNYSVYQASYESYPNNSVPFNKQGLRKLIRQYQKIKPFIEARDRSDILLRNNPDLVNQIFDAWIECQGDQPIYAFYNNASLNGA